MRGRTRFRLCFDVLGVLLVLAAWVTVFYYWDSTRVYVKRWKADSPYVYDEIRPEHLAADAHDYMKISDRDSADRIRGDLSQVIWGARQPDHALMPDEVRRDLLEKRPDTDDCPELEYLDNETLLRLHCQLHRYESWQDLADIDELVVQVGPVYLSSIGLFYPRDPNGVLVIFQNGYASTYHHQYRHIHSLIQAGYTVAAANHIGYGDNHCRQPNELAEWCGIGWGNFNKPLPMRVHFSPLLAAINYAERRMGFSRIAMIGFSAGGWITSVMAAVDERIDRSYPVAGFMPPYLQREGERPPDQMYDPLFDAASMLDQFVLAADRESRRQVQIFNQYDRCCYENRRALLYEDAIRAAEVGIGGGEFRVLIDDTHPQHKISRWAISFILEDLGKGDWP